MTSAASFLISLVDAAARSLLFAAAVGLGLWALRMRNVVAQKAAWILVLAASLAMPLVAQWAAHLSWLPDRDTFVLSGRVLTSTTHSPMHAPPISITAKAYVTRQYDAEPQKPGVTDSSTAVTPGTGRFPAPAIAHVNPETEVPQPAAVSAASPFADFSAVQTLLLLYIATCGVLLFRLVYGAWTAARLWRRAEPVQLEESRLAGIAVRSSSQIPSPVTVGSGIVLPAGFASWDAEKLGIVLAHEGSHVRQRDFALQLAASLYAIVFWFSPLGWWLKRKLSRLSETISDGAAVHHAASHASYAQVLLEFAAMPRPIPIGVAMAHRGHLRSRIEDLLNENNFRQAFSGGRARAAAAVLLVPVALFAATAMVRVHAAAQQQRTPATAPDPAQAPQIAPQPAAAPQAAGSVAPAAPATAPSGPTPPALTSDDDQVISVAPGTSASTLGAQAPGPSGSVLVVPPRGGPYPIVIPDAKMLGREAQALAMLQAQKARLMALDSAAFRYGFGDDGNTYAYVTGDGDKGIHYSGSWFDNSRDQIDKARKVAHGDFLWFQRDGKSYVIDDPALLATIKPMQDKMDALGKQQEGLGKQQEELGKQQEALGQQMEQIKVPTPDMKSELDKLQAVQAKLSAIQGKDASQEQLAEIEGQLADIQGKIGALQGDMGGRMGDLGGKQGELGAQQGKLGAEQGRLGAEQGRIAREMDGKILSMIDEGLKDGKARPVQ